MKTLFFAFTLFFPISLLAEAKEDIRDIAPPLPVFDPLKWIPYVLLLILLLLAAFYIFRRLKRRTKKTAIVKAPHEIAFDDLIAAKKLMAPETCRQFSIALSDALRSYIENRFSIVATRETTEEFLHRVASLDASPLYQHLPVLKGFLLHCDEAKFANTAFEVSTLDSLFQTAWELVNETAEKTTGQSNSDKLKEQA